MTREELFLTAIADGENAEIEPITREEMFLAAAGGQQIKTPTPITRREFLLNKIQSAKTEGIDYLALRCMNALTEYSNDEITSVNNYSFYLCDVLKKIELPACHSILNNAFQLCSALTQIDLTSCMLIRNYAFHSCYQLRTVVLRNENVCELYNFNAFGNCYHILGEVNETYNPDGLADGYIYVPSALIEDYKNATNWNNIASQFRALEDYTVDHTITGKLDENKI